MTTTKKTAMPDPNVCAYCGMTHVGTCPRVKSMEYFPDGRVKRVEFHELRPHAGPTYGAKDFMIDIIGGRENGPF